MEIKVLDLLNFENSANPSILGRPEYTKVIQQI